LLSEPNPLLKDWVFNFQGDSARSRRGVDLFNLRIKIPMKYLFVLAILAAPMLLPIAAQAAPTTDHPTIFAENAIRQAYRDRVNCPINLSGITIVEGWALARWQGEHDGGMVVFQKVDGEWSIVRGTGGSFTYQDLAFTLNVPEAIAKVLIQKGAPELMDTLPIVRGERP
jgi:hypothetical protein